MNIYVVDDHPMMRDAISMVLRRLRPGENIVELDRLGGLVSAAEKNGAPDMICLDLNLPDATGCTGVSTVRGHFPCASLAVYSASPASDFEEACIEAGADIYIEKAAGSAELTAALRGLLIADPAVESDMADTMAGQEESKLSTRQMQIMAMLERGMSNREMGEELGISEHTIKIHVWRLFRRLGVKSRTQALHFARRNGLIPG